MANYPTDIYTGRSGDLDVLIPLNWGNKLNDFAKEIAKISPFFTDRSSEFAGGGDLLYTPGITEMTATTKTNGAAVVLNSPTETAVDLIVRTWEHVSFLIEDKEAASVKNSYYLQEKLTKNAVHTAGQKLEKALTALFSGFDNSVGASNAVLLDSDIRKAIGIVESATKEESNNGNFTWFIDTKVWWNQIAGITTFQLKINTNANDPVLNRPMTSLYGIRVITSDLITFVSSTTGRNNALAHNDALHWATLKLPGQQGKVRFTVDYDPFYKGTLVTADILYGVCENRGTYGVRVLSSAS